jgi:site-specific recombinase XerD
VVLETIPRILVWPLAIDSQSLVDEYVAYQQAAGYAADPKVRPWGARAFLKRYPDLEGWQDAPLEEQLGLHRSLKYFANFLFLKHYLRPPLSYLLAAHPKLAQAGKRYLYRELYAQFQDLGRRVGYADGTLGPALNLLFYLMAYAGKSAELLTEADLQDFEQELYAYRPPESCSFSLRTYSQHLYQSRVLLFHAGILPKEPLRYRPRPARSREQLWAGIAQPISRVVWRYLDQLGTVRALDTVKNKEGNLRRFFGWLVQAHPEVQHLRQITRAQIEEFKLWLQNTPCATGKLYHRHTIKDALSALRCFFQAIQEWDWPEAPERLLVFASDSPISDEPLPRFLDDAQAAALLQAARASDDLFTRVCVETLLRTGLRKGEFLRLELDSVVQIGDTFWLRVPLGKLHNDRYVPLHPAVKRLLDEWVVQRGEELRTNDLFVIHGRRIGAGRVDAAVKRAARAAGLGEDVTAHRLRHTLATQAINRGMTLEAIAALLGHRSLTMTLIYARIADRTVQEQYASVCDDLDALYATAVLGNGSNQSPGLEWEAKH